MTATFRLWKANFVALATTLGMSVQIVGAQDVPCDQWRPIGEGIASSVNALGSYNGELIAGGLFWLLGDGQPAERLARWDGSMWHPILPGIPECDPPCTSPGGSQVLTRVDAAAVYNGELYVGGIFTHAGGVSASNIARWDGQQFRPVGTIGIHGTASSAEPARVEAMLVHDDKLIVAGNFIWADGVEVRSIASWDGTNWGAFGTGVGGTNPRIHDVTVYDGQLIIGGQFWNAVNSHGELARGIARWDGVEWRRIGAPDEFWGNVSGALTVYQGQLIAAGNLRFDYSEPGGPFWRVMRWTGSQWEFFGRFTGGNGGVTDLRVYNGDLIAVGRFTAIDGDPAWGSARYDGTTWSSLGEGMAPIQGNPACESTVLTSLVHDGDFVVGGIFCLADGEPALRVARWRDCDYNECIADIDGDGVVGLSDLAILLSNYGTLGSAGPEDGDINGDGNVDLLDLSLLLAAYGMSC